MEKMSGGALGKTGKDSSYGDTSHNVSSPHSSNTSKTVKVCHGMGRGSEKLREDLVHCAKYSLAAEESKKGSILPDNDTHARTNGQTAGCRKTQLGDASGNKGRGTAKSGSHAVLDECWGFRNINRVSNIFEYDDCLGHCTNGFMDHAGIIDTFHDAGARGRSNEFISESSSSEHVDHVQIHCPRRRLGYGHQ